MVVQSAKSTFHLGLPHMNKDFFITESRRTTPWTGDADATELQHFIDRKVDALYEDKHMALSETEEAGLLNSYKPQKCPYCGHEEYTGYGRTKNGVKRYCCKSCHRTFTIITGTIFQDHKIPISEWIDFCLCLFRFQSFTSISKTNRNAYSTVKYWLSKLFLVLSDYQKDIVLEGTVYIDETFYKVRTQDIEHKDDGTQYRGLSRNQICIGIGTDGKRTIAFTEGYGKVSGKRTLSTFKDHIREGSKLIHDEERGHRLLVDELALKSETYNARLLKGVPDRENPLLPINRKCFFLKKFLNSHSGFDREELQDYLNLFAFIMNEGNQYERVEKILEWSLHCSKTLNYRDKFCK